MTKANPDRHNPALKQLEVLVGNWEMELSNAAFLPDPSNTAKGQISFEWVENGAFIRMRMGDDAIWLISRDDAQSDYHVFYYDSRNVSRIYQMSFSENIWKLWRNSPDFSQRYEGKISHDGNTITARWEKSSDGITWEHDFNISYTRMK
ncbi:MAG TPA: hypothetical protein VL485_20710 [Ktedonobacteraceae bacterium]|nr:hypothetical protein [Ktedonobacteraceae bacterium]